MPLYSYPDFSSNAGRLPRLKPLWLVGAWFVLAFLHPVLLAGTAMGQEIQLPEIVLESSTPQLLQTQTATTVVKVDPKDPPKSVADLLKAVPGLQIRSEGVGQKQTLSVRASNGKQVALLVDGVALGDPRGGSVDLAQIPVEMIEQIEVYRGGRGALAGEGALGGVVVIRLRRSTLSQGRLVVSGGSFGSFGLEARVMHQGVGASYGQTQSNGDFEYQDTNGRVRRRTNNHSLQNRLLLTRNQELWSDATLDVMTWATWTHRGSPGLEQFPSQTGKEAQHTYVASARFEQRHLGGVPELMLDSTLSYAAFRWLFQEPKPYFPPASDTDSLSQRLEFRANLAHRGWAQWWPSLGLSVRHEWSAVERKRGSMPVTPQQWTRTSVDAVPGIAWMPAEFLRQSASVKTAFASPGGFVVMPQLEVSCSLDELAGVAVSGSRAWRMPQFDELYFEGAGIRGNPELKPEDAWGTDLSAWLQLEWLRLDASLFYQKIRDNILFLPKTPYVIQAQNADDVTSWGAELEGTVSWRWLSLGLGAAWLHATLDGSDTTLPLKPQWVFHATPGAKWGPASLSVTVSGQTFFYLDRFEGRREEGRVTVDAQAACELGWGYRVAVQGKNLTNKQDALDAYQYPLPGVSFLVTVSKEFGSNED